MQQLDAVALQHWQSIQFQSIGSALERTGRHVDANDLAELTLAHEFAQQATFAASQIYDAGGAPLQEQTAYRLQALLAS